MVRFRFFVFKNIGTVLDFCKFLVWFGLSFSLVRFRFGFRVLGLTFHHFDMFYMFRKMKM